MAASSSSGTTKPNRRQWMQRLLGRQSAAATPLTGGAEPYVGEIILVPFTFAPAGYLECNGQLLAISQYDVLFVLIGTTYGGDGQTTFALPNLNGRVPVHAGQGPGLSSRIIGQQSGNETHTLIQSQIPAHNHSVLASANSGTQANPGGALPANSGTGTAAYHTTAGTNLNAAATQPAGSSQPHNNLQPYLGLKFCIAVEGIFPPQN